MTFVKFIKEWDIYGHTINWNFNKRGVVHNTFCGGLLSFFIKISVIIYIGINTKKMMNYENTLFQTATSPLDLEAEGDVNFAKTEVVVFHVIKKQLTDDFVQFTDED